MAQRRAVLCHCGVVINKVYGPLIKDYIKTLTFVYAPRIGASKRCTIYKIEIQQNRIEILILPRDAQHVLADLGFTIQDRFAITRTFAPPSLEFLYDDQLRIIEHLRGLWDRKATGTACLNLRAGYGKTFVAAGLIATMHMRALYIVPMRELAKQTLADLSASLGVNLVVCARSSAEFWEIARDPRDGIVCIAVINTVISALSDTNRPAECESLSKFFSLIVFDEVHTYCSTKRLDVFWRAQTRFMFGMSATIGDRRDGFDFALAHHLPPMIDAANIEGFSYGENQFHCTVRAISYHAANEFSKNLRHETTDQVFAHYMYEQFARDPARNTLIVESARGLLAEGHCLFIFTEERAHAENIALLLEQSNVATSDDTKPLPRLVIFYGGVSDEERRIALCGGARVIIATYSYSGTGVSIVRMTAMILATPRYSGMKQIVGRILRRGSDAAIQRVVVDIIDKKTCLARQFRLRKNAYDFYGAQYEHQKVLAPATLTEPTP